MHALSTVIEKASANNLMGSGVLNLLQSQVEYLLLLTPVTLGINAYLFVTIYSTTEDV